MFIKLKTTAYSNPQTETEIAVRAALDAFSNGPIPAMLQLALENLLASYDNKLELPDVETAEKYVAEAWAEYTNPKGAVFKG